MTIINQHLVMDQRLGTDGIETCGYHALKNSILGLMWAQGLISDKQFTELRTHRELFNAIYKSTKRKANLEGDVDLTLVAFEQILKEIKSGKHDFSTYELSEGIVNQIEKKAVKNLKKPTTGKLSEKAIEKCKKEAVEQYKKGLFEPFKKENIRKLNLDDNIISMQTYTRMGTPPVGLWGGLSDLNLAASLVKFAREKGKCSRSFAIGLNNEHWVTVVVKQEESGKRTWHFMDSYGNQTTYQNKAVAIILDILSKSEPELQKYLANAYDNTYGSLLKRNYERFFDQETGLAKTDKFSGYGYEEKESWDAVDYYVKQGGLQHRVEILEAHFQFMVDAGWFDSKGKDELKRMRVLYNIASFILKNAEENTAGNEAKLILAPICEKLERVLPTKKTKSVDDTDKTVAKESTPSVKKLTQERSRAGSRSHKR